MNDESMSNKTVYVYIYNIQCLVQNLEDVQNVSCIPTWDCSMKYATDVEMVYHISD